MVGELVDIVIAASGIVPVDGAPYGDGGAVFRKDADGGFSVVFPTETYWLEGIFAILALAGTALSGAVPLLIRFAKKVTHAERRLEVIEPRLDHLEDRVAEHAAKLDGHSLDDVLAAIHTLHVELVDRAGRR